ncbi:hypothetical protein VTK56DRAFT_1746 [Thermocarpiscus australiensis]
MPSIFGKPGSTSRAKPGRKSIRGTISGPIPIPSTPDDDEFPIRNPGSAKALTSPDDEFPIRRPGTGIAAPLPPSDEGASSSREQVVETGEPGHSDQQDQQACGHEHEHAHEHDIDNEPDQEQMEVQVATPSDASDAANTSGGSSADAGRDVRPEPPSNSPPAPPPGPSTPTGRPASRPPSRSSPRETPPLGTSPSRGSPATRRATNPVLSTVRYSTVSDPPSKPAGQSKDSPQRKKSTLRSALGRLFGRGRKKNGNGSQVVAPESGGDSVPPDSTQQHRSDPTALGRPNRISPKRSASLPINELDRPLRSHSIGPDDMMAIESVRNSLHAEAPGASAETEGRRRAATAVGRTFARPHFSFNPEWGAGLSPRPASAQGRGSQLGGQAEPEDPNEIGRALTSDSGSGLRRRSRSLSGLQDLVGARLGRRRSAEIRYWRESYDQGFMSRLSSNAQDDIDDAGMADVSAPESPAVERPPKTPPQPFDFGLLRKEMVGMKITQAADMDIRLGNLESRTSRLERLVDQLRHAVTGVGGAFGGTMRAEVEPPSRDNSKDAARPSSSRRSLETDSRSQVSFGEAPTYVASLHPPSSSASRAHPPVTTTASPALRSPANRPTSTATLRGAGATTPQDDHLMVSQLRKELEAERAARQALESQVRKLSERVNTLSTTMFAMVRRPSESRSQERLGLASSSSVVVGGGSGGGSPLLQAQAQAQQPKTLLVPPPQRQEQLSVFETDDDDEEEEEETEGGSRKRGSSSLSSSSAQAKQGPENEEGEFTEDDFQTPREDRTQLPYGAFCEGLRPGDEDEDEEGDGGDGDEDEDEDDPKRKKAARTLSLSQLTLGKGHRTRI